MPQTGLAEDNLKMVPCIISIDAWNHFFRFQAKDITNLKFPTIIHTSLFMATYYVVLS